MKEIDNVKYFDISEISGILHDRFNDTELIMKFDTGEIKGKKIDDKWYAKKEDIEEYQEAYIQKIAYFTSDHTINLTKTQLNGRILDIGGGGEGVIGQYGGNNVVAIDPSERELRGPPGDYLRIIMDGKNLKFLNETFDTVTSFFTFMYIPIEEHKLVFNEIYRVLKQNGTFLFWDLNVPKKFEESKEVYVVRLEIDIGKKIISTGYGTKWNKELDINHYVKIGKDIGFKVIHKEKVDDDIFFIEFSKD